jgi:hypothetical protein
MTLRNAEAGVLRIAQGRVWATVDGPHLGPANNQGDVILTAGQGLSVAPGQRVVIEPWDHDLNQVVHFSWDSLRPKTQLRVQSGSRWQEAVVQPMRDFGLALQLAMRALGRLAWGLAGYWEFSTAGRGRVMPCMKSNQP